MARISAAENSGHCLRNIEAAVAGQPGQQRVGEAEDGGFAAGAHIVASSPVRCGGRTSAWRKRRIRLPVAFLPRGCYRRPRFEREVQSYGVSFEQRGVFWRVSAFAGFIACRRRLPIGRQRQRARQQWRGQHAKAPPKARSSQSELRAYCPPVTLREGTAFFNTYEKGATGRPDQAASTRPRSRT